MIFKPEKHKAKYIVFLGIGSLIWCAAVIIIAGGVISGLERPMQGENVILPWPVCVGITMFFQMMPLILVPISGPGTRKQKAFYVVSVVAAFFIANFLLGGIGALDKAWRRGW